MNLILHKNYVNSKLYMVLEFAKQDYEIQECRASFITQNTFHFLCIF